MCGERLHDIKDILLCAVEHQIADLEHVNTCELGEVIDMIKDLEETIYYCTVTEAMHDPNNEWKTKKSDHHQTWSDNDRQMDEREGRSHMSRKMYIEAKDMKKDKATQLHELEKYMQELSLDITEMIADASPEEKQYLEKKITALASKIGQMK